MGFFRRFCAVAIALLLATLPACTSAPAAPTATGTTEPVAATTPTEHLTISVNLTEAEKQKNDALYDYFSDKFNIELKPVPFSTTEWQERIRIWIVSNSLPDLVWINVDENTFSEYASWAREGIFQPLPADLRSEYPNIGALLDQEDVNADELLTINGKLYAYPTIRNTASQDYSSPLGFYYRRDWAEKVGLAQPGDVYTWDQFVELGQAFVKQDPGNNGAGKTVGAGAQAEYFPQAFGVYQLASENGLGAFQRVGDHYEWTAARPETLEGLTIAKKLYDSRILWSENALGSSHLDKYKAGLMGIVFDEFDNALLTDMRKSLQRTFLGINVDKALRPMHVKGPDGTFWAEKTVCFSGAVSLRAGVDSETVSRVLSMFDWLLSEEGTLFRTYGFESKDYAKTDSAARCLWSRDLVTMALIDPYPSGCRQFYSLAASTDEDLPIYPKSVVASSNNVAMFQAANAKFRSVDVYSNYFDSLARDDTIAQLAEQTHDEMVNLVTTARAQELSKLWEQWVSKKLPIVQPFLVELTVLAQQ